MISVFDFHLRFQFLTFTLTFTCDWPRVHLAIAVHVFLLWLEIAWLYPWLSLMIGVFNFHLRLQFLLLLMIAVCLLIGQLQHSFLPHRFLKILMNQYLLRWPSFQFNVHLQWCLNLIMIIFWQGWRKWYTGCWRGFICQKGHSGSLFNQTSVTISIEIVPKTIMLCVPQICFWFIYQWIYRFSKVFTKIHESQSQLW